MRDDARSWWAPIWRGLVVDPEAKHYRRMGVAIWLYLYLVIHADRATGRLPLKLATVARQTAIPRRSLERWLWCLREKDYVRVEHTGRRISGVILRWKSILGHRQNWRRTPPDVTEDSARTGGVRRDGNGRRRPSKR
jgi:hypothetical protein